MDTALWLDMLVIVFFWFTSILIVNPIGDFPLNDDWSYGLTVKNLLDTGLFKPLGWTSMPLISNVLWGSLFCVPQGFSFTALRMSTLVLSLAGTIGTYLLMRELRQPRWLTIMAALTLFFNPVHFSLSNTFMTDVQYTAMTVLAGLFLVRNLRTGHWRDLIVGTLFAIAATLSRQVAISIPIAFALSLAIKHGLTRKSAMRAVIPMTVCIGGLFLFQRWLSLSGNLPASYYIKSEGLIEAIIDTLTKNPHKISHYLINLYVSLYYFGLFLLPLTTIIAFRLFKRHRVKTFVTIISSVVVLIATHAGFALHYGKIPTMPLSGNIIVPSGIGPLTLRDTYVLHINNVSALPAGFWTGVTLLSIFGAALLLTMICVFVIDIVPRLRPSKIKDGDAVCVFLSLSTVIYMQPLLVGDCFDRYLMPCIPLIAAAIAIASADPFESKSNASLTVRALSLAMLIPLLLYSVSGTRDYLTWNRLRWKALRNLHEHRSAMVTEIDGGFEFNGLLLYNPEYRPHGRKSWWWVHDDKYQVGFGLVPGYKIIDEHKFQRWLPPSDGKIVVMERK